MPRKFKKIKLKIFSILFITSLFLLNATVETKAMAKFGGNPNFSTNTPGVKIITVSPPEVFNLPNSKTTNFTHACTLKEALNIVLDVAGKNTIEFQEPIVDMCDNEIIKNLDKYIQINKTGEVNVRSDLLPALKNKTANITMRNLPFETEPNVEIDGKLATEKDIENKKWDSYSKTLTFQAKHFTTYKAVEKNQPTAQNTEKEILKNNKEFFSFSASEKQKIFLFSAFIFILFMLIFYILHIKHKT